MALYQTSVLKNYITLQEQEIVAKAYKKYTKYFLNPTIQENIRSSKEEEYQGIFLTELFVNILDYTLKPKVNFNLVAEYKNQNNSRKADGAILQNDVALAVIELKGTKTKDLESIRKQAFDYKANQKGCVYVITSNFEKLRFYINDATEFEEFNLFELTKERFQLFYLCLQKDNILSNVPLKIKEASIVQEEKITKDFYKDYSLFKRELYRDLVKNNKDITRDLSPLLHQEKITKLTLFKKSQKLIDRFLFIFFAEDRNLLPANSTLQILEDWNKLKELDAIVPLYDRFKLYFKFLDEGRAGTNNKAEIYAYNGGLFKPDTILNSLLIDDNLLYKHTQKLANYDFASQVDVNILGHIFENSLNEIESVNAEIEGTDFDKQKSKRKKDGVFYTPKYITKYIVENTVGKLCTEKKVELGIKEEEYFKGRKNRKGDTIKKLVGLLDQYRDWLLQLTICDPACGSGAFLNQALNFLIAEHTYIDELKTKVLGGGLQFSDIENTILENNIFGVDLNEESVEIAKLSLWLRTAQPRRKLNDLSSNIKCGNSLIDSKTVAGDKAFHWETQFPKVFKETNKKAYHITTAIHDSRTSARMKRYKVRERREMGTNPYPNVIYFTPEDDFNISQTIAEIVQEDNLNLLAYNICADHIHLLLVCELEEIPAIMQKIKGRTSYNNKGVNKGLNKGLKPLVEKEKENNKPLWQQKYSPPKEITTEEQLYNTVKYIQTNRAKHELPKHNKATQQVIDNMCCSKAKAFKTEYKGGFDVIIGNPPYVRVQNLDKNSIAFFEANFISATGKFDIYVLFNELSVRLLKSFGVMSFIQPHRFLNADFGKGLRLFFGKNKYLSKIISFSDIDIFEGATTYTAIFLIEKKTNESILYKEYKNVKTNYISENLQLLNSGDFIKTNYSLLNNSWEFKDKKELDLLNKFRKHNILTDFTLNISQGVIPGSDKIYYLEIIESINQNYLVKNQLDKKTFLIEKSITKRIVKGNNITKYVPAQSDFVIIYPYVLTDKIQKLYSLKELEKIAPLAYQYLLTHKDFLIALRKKYKTNPIEWYGFHRARDMRFLETDKIITTHTSIKPSFTLSNQSEYFNQNVYGIELLDKELNLQVLGLLNSKLTDFFMKNTSSMINGGYYLYKTDYISQIPIIEKRNLKLINKVEEALKINNSSYSFKIKFQTYLKQKFQLEKLSKKLQNWHDLEFGEFIKELNKAIKANIKLGYKGLKPLAKKDEFEWLELFEENKEKAQALQTQINQTDAAIDQMVYELYGLTEEEIAMVENS